MYAIIQDGARQFQVEPGQEVDIDYRDLTAGEELTFDRVLAYRDDAGLQIGRPTLAAKVTAKVLSTVQGPKLVIQKSPPPQERASADRPPPDLHPRGDRQDSTRLGWRGADGDLSLGGTGVSPVLSPCATGFAAGRWRRQCHPIKIRALAFLPCPPRIHVEGERGSAAFRVEGCSAGSPPNVWVCRLSFLRRAARGDFL